MRSRKYHISVDNGENLKHITKPQKNRRHINTSIHFRKNHMNKKKCWNMYVSITCVSSLFRPFVCGCLFRSFIFRLYAVFSMWWFGTLTSTQFSALIKIRLEWYDWVIYLCKRHPTMATMTTSWRGEFAASLRFEAYTKTTANLVSHVKHIPYPIYVRWIHIC